TKEAYIYYYLGTLVFSPDGKTLATGQGDYHTLGTIGLSPPSPLRKMPGHKGNVSSVAYSHDGTKLISGSADKCIRIWDAAKGNSIATWEGHADCVSSGAFAPDGTIAASGSWDRTVRLWDVKTGKEIDTLPRHRGTVWGTAFSADGKVVATAGA